MPQFIPEAVEREIVTILFAEAEQLKWEQLNARERSKQYQSWLSRSDVGDRVASFMTREAARVWIKDGPMKEYSRALNGLGKHADLISSQRAQAPDFVRFAMGADWEVAPNTQEIKPLRVTVRNRRDGRHLVFAWGPARDFKHLVWAALSGSRDPAEWMLCVVAPLVDATPNNVVSKHQRIAQRCGLLVKHVTI